MNFKDHLRGLEKLRDSTRSSHGESHTRKKYAHGGSIKGEMKALASKGRYGDTKLAEIGTRTAKVLDKVIHRGRKDINPRTGLREYPPAKRTADDAEIKTGPESGEVPPPTPAPSANVRDVLRPVMSQDHLLHWADLNPGQDFVKDAQFFASQRYDPHKLQPMSVKKKHVKHTTHFIDMPTAHEMVANIRNNPEIQGVLAAGGNFEMPFPPNVQKYSTEINPNTGGFLPGWKGGSDNFGGGGRRVSRLGTNASNRSHTPNGIRWQVTHYEN